jgi:hypothetical protein
MMSLESKLVGLAGIVLGIAIYMRTNSILPSLVPLLIGIAIIIFYREKDCAW